MATVRNWPVSATGQTNLNGRSHAALLTSEAST
jgi:hypothetical protein